MILTEKCSCGAEIKIEEFSMRETGMDVLREWRNSHIKLCSIQSGYVVKQISNMSEEEFKVHFNEHYTPMNQEEIMKDYDIDN